MCADGLAACVRLIRAEISSQLSAVIFSLKP